MFLAEYFNMKTLVTFGLILAVHMVHCNNYIKSTEETVKECKKETGFDGTIPSIKNEGAPKAAKCFLACIMEKKEVLKKDGSIDKDKAKEVVVKEYPDKKDELFKIIEECSNKADPSLNDQCEAAYKYVVCRREKLGINPK